MEKRIAKRKVGKLMAAAVGAAGLMGLGSSQSNAALVIDVRATAVSGGGTVVGNGNLPGGGKTVNGLGSGSIVTMGVFAQVSGTNGNNTDEWLQSVGGSFSTTAGDLRANFVTPSSVNGVNGWNGSGFQNGSIQDIDADGDLDLGSAGTDIVGKFFARSNSPDSRTLDLATDPDNGALIRGTPHFTTIDANTTETRIGTIRLSYQSGGQAFANFIPRAAQEGALWWEDTPDRTTNQHDGTTGLYQAGSPIALNGVPEPGSLGLMSLAALGLLRRRK